MIRIKNVEVAGMKHAIRGMRNPLNSWDKSDSYSTHIEDAQTLETAEFEYFVGADDLELMQKLSKAGADHRKYMRMIAVYLDITAPLYWWKEFDTYKVGTVANSCSTMHKIHSKTITVDDFSCEHLTPANRIVLDVVINALNNARLDYNYNNNKDCWWQMVQMLPSSYNQTRTIMLNYEVLANMYHSRKTHKLDEWREFCEWIKSLPYSELVTRE